MGQVRVRLGAGGLPPPRLAGAELPYEYSKELGSWQPHPRETHRPARAKGGSCGAAPPQTDGVLILLARPLPLFTSWCS